MRAEWMLLALGTSLIGGTFFDWPKSLGFALGLYFVLLALVWVRELDR